MLQQRDVVPGVSDPARLQAVANSVERMLRLGEWELWALDPLASPRTLNAPPFLVRRLPCPGLPLRGPSLLPALPDQTTGRQPTLRALTKPLHEEVYRQIEGVYSI